MNSKMQLSVYDGEASETDSDESIQNSFYHDSISVDLSDKAQCQAINGEDSESGDEKERNSAAKTLTSAQETIEKKPIDRNQSLLHIKLKESNTKFYNDFEEFLKGFIKDNEKSLNEINHNIAKSQVTLEGASPVIENLKSQSISLQNKLDTLLSSNFLSNVKINY